MMSRTAEIKLTVELDGDNLPTGIEWEATEAAEQGASSCQSMLLSLWDSESKTTAAIDLWTKDMSIDDMNRYFYQVIHKMADSYFRATRNGEMSNLIHEFGEGFGAKLGLLSKGGTDAFNDVPADLVTLSNNSESQGSI
jgi:gliding motility-associated protein GldC